MGLPFLFKRLNKRCLTSFPKFDIIPYNFPIPAFYSPIAGGDNRGESRLSNGASQCKNHKQIYLVLISAARDD